MKFAGDVTRSDIKDLVESVIFTAITNSHANADCDFIVMLDRDWVPHIQLDIDDKYLRVSIETQDLVDDEGSVVGWTFNPRIFNGAMARTFEEDDVASIYQRWAEIAKVAKAIYEVELYPNDYID